MFVYVVINDVDQYDEYGNVTIKTHIDGVFASSKLAKTYMHGMIGANSGKVSMQKHEVEVDTE